MHSILITTHISKEEFEVGISLGMTVTSLPFIQTSAINLHNKRVLFKKSKEANTWVFTSKNALPILQQYPQLKAIAQEKTILVSGKKTYKLMQEMKLQSRIGLESGAEGIIEQIESGNGTEPYLYFCGNLRLNTLPSYFENSNLNYSEIETYKTEEQSIVVNQKEFNTIAFCSPSAVKSFFKNNTALKEIQYLAIGKTTAKAVKEYSKNCTVSPEATIKGLIQFAAQIKDNK